MKQGRDKGWTVTNQKKKIGKSGGSATEKNDRPRGPKVMDGEEHRGRPK